MHGNADFKIDCNGRWFHDGAPIRRFALVKLFSDKALRIDSEGLYWLQSPYEKYPVDVADVPFVIVDYVSNRGAIDCITNMDEIAPLGPDAPLEVRDYNGGQVPYVHIRDGLYARLSRNVFYALVHEFGVHIKSRNMVFALGDAGDE